MDDDTRPDLPGGTYLTAADRQDAARAAYLASLLARVPLSPAELGDQFGRSRRWADDRIAEVRAEYINGNGDGGSPEEEPAYQPASFLPADADQAGRRVRTAIRWVTTIAVAVVAACAARASYDHQRRFVEMAGETEAAWYLPLSVDGMMLAASLNMLVRRWDNQPAGWLTWCALILGGIASLAANVAAADPTMIGRFVAAWPPICLIVSYELLMQQLPTRQGPPAPAHLPARAASLPAESPTEAAAA